MYLSQFYHFNNMNVDQDITKFNFNNASMIRLETASSEYTKMNEKTPWWFIAYEIPRDILYA